MTENKTTAVPTAWLRQVAELLFDMCGEGIGIIGRADPEDLMQDLSDYLGTGETDDPWTAAVEQLGGHVGESA